MTLYEEEEDWESVATCLNNVSETSRGRYSLDEALAYAEQALAIGKKYLGGQHPVFFSVHWRNEVIEQCAMNAEKHWIHEPFCPLPITRTYNSLYRYFPVLLSLHNEIHRAGERSTS